MASPFTSILTGMQSAEDKQRKRQQEDADRAAKAEMAKLQRDALMSGMQDKKDAKAATATNLQRRVATLRKHPKLAGYGDDELAGIAMDEPTYSKLLIESIGAKKRTPKPMMVDGKPAMVWEDETGTLTDEAGQPVGGVKTPYAATPATEDDRRPQAFALDGKPIQGFTDRQGRFYGADGKQVTGAITPYQAPARGRAGGGSGMTNSNMLTLRGQFNGEAGVKTAAEIAAAHRKVTASAQNPSPAGDISLLVAYNKMIDPGAVVREQDFKVAAKAGSFSQQVQAAATQVANGQRLTPEQRADFVARSQDLAKAQAEQFRGVYSRYTNDAKAAGLDPARVVYDPFEGVFDAPSTRKANPDDKPGNVTLGGGRAGGGAAASRGTSADPEFDALMAKAKKRKP